MHTQTNMGDQHYRDRILTCREGSCRQPFLFSAGEQQFFAERGYKDPSRCKNCLARRKATKHEEVQPKPSPKKPKGRASAFAKVEVQHRRLFGSRAAHRPRIWQDDGS